MGNYASKKTLTRNNVLAYANNTLLPDDSPVGTIAFVEGIKKFYIKYGSTDWRPLIESSAYFGPVSYTLARGPINGLVTEADTMIVYITTTGVPNGTSISYSWSGINADDIQPTSSVTGSAIIIEGTASVTVELADDLTTEGEETAVFSLSPVDSLGNLTQSPEISFTIEDTSVAAPLTTAIGQVAYTTPGTYNWTCPANVYDVSVVCVGSSGYWDNASYSASGGGGLGWKNNISVTPGQSYTVQVSGHNNSTIATDSFFISAITVKGGGASSGSGGTYVGDGGGNGGNGGGYNRGGGGGAGGYNGQGGQGGPASSGGSSAVALSGGGGGGAGGNQSAFGGTGGGVGILGLGATGAGGTWINTVSWADGGGRGGSGGENGAPTNFAGAAPPALYGGGVAGSNGVTVSGGTPGNGAVRLIWGTGRAFPNTRTADE
jgi:hypothetical protein